MVVPPGQDPYPPLTPEDEWAFVMKTVRTYMRAGCAALALDLGMPLFFIILLSSCRAVWIRLTLFSTIMALLTSITAPSYEG